MYIETEDKNKYSRLLLSCMYYALNCGYTSSRNGMAILWSWNVFSFLVLHVYKSFKLGCEMLRSVNLGLLLINVHWKLTYDWLVSIWMIN